MKEFRKVAKEMQGEFYFAFSGLKAGVEQRVAEALGVHDTMVPAVFIARGNANDLKKYKMEAETADINAHNIKQFIEKYRAGDLK